MLPGGQRIPSVDLESGRLLGSGGNRRDSLGLCLITHLSRSVFGRCRLISETQHESLGFDALCLDGLAGLPSRGSQPLGFGLGRLERVTSLYLRFVTHGARFVTGPVKLCGSFLAALHRLGCIGLGALAKFAHLGLDLASPSLHLGLEPRPLLAIAASTAARFWSASARIRVASPRARSTISLWRSSARLSASAIRAAARCSAWATTSCAEAVTWAACSSASRRACCASATRACDSSTTASD